MYKKKKKKHKLIIIFISCIIIFILLFVSFTLNRNYTLVESIGKDITMFFNKVIMYPFTALNKSKNEDLSKSYIIQKNVNTSLEEEIQELKKALELKKTLTEYDTVTATVLSRNKSYWFNTVTIDKGKSSGIKKDMAVVTKNGFVGKINRVSSNSSEVKLITSDDINYKVSVSISTESGDTNAILNGYDRKEKLLMVNGVDKTFHIKEGDKVLTSGLGGREPRGIYIGRVKKIKSDKYNLSRTLYLETGQDFNGIHYLTVLKEKTK